MTKKKKKEDVGLSREAFATMFSSMLASGELDAALSSHGWQKNAAGSSKETIPQQGARKEKAAAQQQKQQQQQATPPKDWTLVKKRKTKHQPPQAAAPQQEAAAKPQQVQQPQKREELDPSGWSGKVVANTAALSRDEACVCMVGVAEAKRAVAELSSENPMAILSPLPVDEQGEQVQVLVKSSNGRLDTRKRYLIQLGVGQVTYMCDHVQKAAPVGQQDPAVVVYFVQGKTPPAVWKAAAARPREAVDNWLKKFAGVEKCGKFREPRMTATQIAVTVDTAPNNVQKVLDACGKEGVFTRRFYTKQEHNEEFKLAPLETKHDLHAALRIASSISYAVGVLPTRKGWGVRVPADKLAEAIKITCPEDEDKVLGSEYEVQGLPLSWTDDHVIKFLGDWKAKPVWSFRKGWQATWVVRARTPPPAKVLQNADEDTLRVLATIQEREVKPKKQEAVYRWKPEAKSKSRALLPTAWSKHATAEAKAEATADATAEGKEDEEKQDEDMGLAPPHIAMQAPQTPMPRAASNVMQGDPPNFHAMMEEAIKKAMAPVLQQLTETQEQLRAVQNTLDADSDGELVEEENQTGGGKEGKGKGKGAVPPPAPALPTAEHGKGGKAGGVRTGPY